MMYRDIKAIQFIQVREAMVGRLPAGVETTHSLLVAMTTTPNTPISLATAVNRFLNKFLNNISHLAISMWGLSNCTRLGHVTCA